MAPSWTQTRCTPTGRGVLLLTMILSFLLPCTDCRPQPTWGYTAYEVVIPRKLGSGTGKTSQEEVSYTIDIQGINYTIHLRQKDFVIKTIPVFTRNSQGEIVTEQPHVPAGCYYHGYVEGIPDSTVTVTTCSGLRGLLHVGNSSYSIEPLPGPTTREHLLLEKEAIPGMVMYKMRNNDRLFPGPGKEIGQFQSKGDTRYLELFVVVDKKGFDTFGKSVKDVALEVIEIINLVDGLFSSFNLRVLLTALEVWAEKNPIVVTKNITQVLHNFNVWRRHLSPTYAVHDVACLFASTDFGSGTRASRPGNASNFASACNRKRASAVVSFAKQPYMDTAVDVARALGHALGMRYDGRYCKCGNASECIMSTRGTVNRQFSNCSRRDYTDFITSGLGFCLNKAPESVIQFPLQRCGNGVLDAGEECDCGSDAQCKLNLCCDNECKIKEGAVCTSGGCCKNCEPLPEGEVCRESTGLCDLPEYCSGTSADCPADVAKQDGTVCAEDGYCYSGKCRSRTLQCRSIFGEEAKSAPLTCFLEVNMKGDRFGNCWGDGTDVNYQKCKPENVLCGRVQCMNVEHLPQMEDHVTIIQSLVDDIWCWGTDFHFGVDVLDVGAIKDGTHCGEKKICINQTCVPEEKYFTSNCSAEKTCGGRGVCNTRGNCHCDSGWAPPFCQFSGSGGSIDSGPTLIAKQGVSTFVSVSTIIIIVVLALAALVIVYVRKLRGTRAKKRPIRRFWAGEQVPGRDAKDRAGEGRSKAAGAAQKKRQKKTAQKKNQKKAAQKKKKKKAAQNFPV